MKSPMDDTERLRLEDEIARLQRVNAGLAQQIRDLEKERDLAYLHPVTTGEAALRKLAGRMVRAFIEEGSLNHFDIERLVVDVGLAEYRDVMTAEDALKIDGKVGGEGIFLSELAISCADEVERGTDNV